MEERNIVGEFIETYYERALTDEQIDALHELQEVSEEEIASMREDKKCLCVKVEHKTGVFCVEFPIYCTMFHVINSIPDDEMRVKENLFHVMMEDCVTIGDADYLKDKIKARQALKARQEA